MPKIDFPDIDECITLGDVVRYFRALGLSFRDLGNYLLMQAGMLKAVCKEEDRRLGIREAGRATRLLFLVVPLTYTMRKWVKATERRVIAAYSPASRQRPRRRGRIDFDRED